MGAAGWGQNDRRQHDGGRGVGGCDHRPNVDCVAVTGCYLGLSIALIDETITIPQFRTLVTLSNRGPMNLATLAGLLDVQPSTTGRMVDRLLSAGLIDRRPHSNSHRELVVELELTAHGRQVVRRVTAHRRDEIARIVETMPPQARRGLMRALTGFTTAARESAARLEAYL
jgi:DNA-binding MarR family transcriptional regulator